MPFVPIEAGNAPDPVARAAHWSESVNARVLPSGSIDAAGASALGGTTVSGQSILFDETPRVDSGPQSIINRYGHDIVRPTQKPITDPDIVKAMRGRPTRYKPEFCQLVQEDLLAGFSLSAFAGRLCVAPATVRVWMDEHPEFQEAVARGKSLRLRMWESEAIGVAQTGGQGSQATMIIFGLKNMGSDEWKEKQEVAHSGAISLSALISDSMKTIEHVPDMIEQSPVVDGATSL